MRLIRLEEVKHTTGLGRSTIYKYIEEGTFPKSVSLGERAVAWIEIEIVEWVMAKIEARDAHVPSQHIQSQCQRDQPMR